MSVTEKEKILDKTGKEIVEGSKIKIGESETCQWVGTVVRDEKGKLRAQLLDNTIHHYIDCWSWAITVIDGAIYYRLKAKLDKEKMIREEYWRLESLAERDVQMKLDEFKKNLNQTNYGGKNE